MPTVEKSVEIHASIEEVFAFIADINNHKCVSPPQTQEELVDAGDYPMRVGTVVTLRAKYGGIRWTLISRITAFEPPHSAKPNEAFFCDQQVKGPFAVWKHEHTFKQVRPGVTGLTDRFIYSAPLGPLGLIAEKFWLNKQMRMLMGYMQVHQKRIIEEQAALPLNR